MPRELKRFHHDFLLAAPRVVALRQHNVLVHLEVAHPPFILEQAPDSARCAARGRLTFPAIFTEKPDAPVPWRGQPVAASASGRRSFSRSMRTKQQFAWIQLEGDVPQFGS